MTSPGIREARVVDAVTKQVMRCINKDTHSGAVLNGCDAGLALRRRAVSARALVRS